MRVLVTGATGFVGRHVVPALIEAGHSVRAIARGRHRVALPVDAELVRGSVTDPDLLRQAADGMDACVHLVAIIVERGEETFSLVNHLGTAAVVRALADAGVERLVHQSALGASPDPRFPYLRSKWMGEEAVRSSGLDWTVLRPSVLFGPGAGFFRPIVWTLRWMPVYPLPAGGRTRFRPLAVSDLAGCIVRALEGAASKETVDLGGPDELTFRQIAEVCAHALGKRRAMLPVPVWAARPFAATQRFRREPLVTNPQLDMVALDNTCDPADLERAFGFPPQSFADGDLRWLAQL